MRTEKTLYIIALAGGVLKFLHVPGASLVLVGALLALSVIYFPLAFYFFSDQNLKQQNIPLSVATGFLLSVIPLGVLFKIQHWEGSRIMLGTGIAGGIFITALIFILGKKAPKELRLYYLNMKIRSTLMTALAVVFFF
jgi:hypothetical protein